MKVVLDANVLIASYAGRGLCHQLVELCIARDEVISTQSIIADVREKMIRKLRLPDKVAAEAVRVLNHSALIMLPAPVVPGTCRDMDDHDVLGAADAAHADCIVTGDDDLLSLRTYRGIPILTPRAYWERYCGESPP